MRNKLIWPLVAIVCASIIGSGLYYGLRSDDQSGWFKSSSVKGVSQQEDNSDSGTKEITVYVTRTGKCYHRAGCRYLSRSKIPMPLRKAKQRYRPCSVCNPPR